MLLWLRLQLRLDYDTTTIQLRCIVRACFQFDALQQNSYIIASTADTTDVLSGKSGPALAGTENRLVM